MKETWVGLHANPAKPISNLDQANFQTRLGQYAIPARPTCHAGLAYLFCLKTQTKIQKGKIQSNKVQLSSKLTEMVLRMFRNYPGTSKPKKFMDQSILKCSSPRLSFSQKRWKLTSSCSWGIYQNELVYMFLRGTSTYPTSRNTIKSLETRSPSKHQREGSRSRKTKTFQNTRSWYNNLEDNFLYCLKINLNKFRSYRWMQIEDSISHLLISLSL